MRLPILTFVALAAIFGAGCTSEPRASAFKIASDDDAEAVVRTYLDAAAQGDESKMTSELCDRKAPAHLSLTGYTVVVVEPAWSGGEPYFRVDVELDKADGRKDTLSLSVRAREGCIDRFLGVPVEPAHRSAGEIAL